MMGWLFHLTERSLVPGFFCGNHESIASSFHFRTIPRCSPHISVVPYLINHFLSVLFRGPRHYRVFRFGAGSVSFGWVPLTAASPMSSTRTSRKFYGASQGFGKLLFEFLSDSRPRTQKHTHSPFSYCSQSISIVFFCFSCRLEMQPGNVIRVAAPTRPLSSAQICRWTFRSSAPGPQSRSLNTITSRPRHTRKSIPRKCSPQAPLLRQRVSFHDDISMLIHARADDGLKSTDFPCHRTKPRVHEGPISDSRCQQKRIVF